MVSCNARMQPGTRTRLWIPVSKSPRVEVRSVGKMGSVGGRDSRGQQFSRSALTPQKDWRIQLFYFLFDLLANARATIAEMKSKQFSQFLVVVDGAFLLKKADNCLLRATAAILLLGKRRT